MRVVGETGVLQTDLDNLQIPLGKRQTQRRAARDSREGQTWRRLGRTFGLCGNASGVY